MVLGPGGKAWGHARSGGRHAGVLGTGGLASRARSIVADRHRGDNGCAGAGRRGGQRRVRCVDDLGREERGVTHRGGFLLLGGRREGPPIEGGFVSWEGGERGHSSSGLLSGAGVAVANTSFRTLALGELEDAGDPKTLESLVVQVGAREGRREGRRVHLLTALTAHR